MESFSSRAADREGSMGQWPLGSLSEQPPSLEGAGRVAHWAWVNVSQEIDRCLRFPFFERPIDEIIIQQDILPFSMNPFTMYQPIHPFSDVGPFHFPTQNVGLPDFWTTDSSTSPRLRNISWARPAWPPSPRAPEEQQVSEAVRALDPATPSPARAPSGSIPLSTRASSTRPVRWVEGGLESPRVFFVFPVQTLPLWHGVHGKSVTDVVCRGTTSSAALSDALSLLKL